MKIIIGFILILSAKAYACPDLTGQYKCTYGDRTVIMDVTQKKDSKNITTYNFANDGEPNLSVKDGIKEVTVYEDEFSKGSYDTTEATHFCTPNKAQIFMNMWHTDSKGNKSRHSILKVTTFIEDGNLVTLMQSDLDNKGVLSKGSKDICVRQ